MPFNVFLAFFFWLLMWLFVSMRFNCECREIPQYIIFLHEIHQNISVKWMVCCRMSYVLSLFSSSLNYFFVEFIYSIKLIVAGERSSAFLTFLFLAKLKNPSCHCKVHTTKYILDHRALFSVPLLYWLLYTKKKKKSLHRMWLNIW